MENRSQKQIRWIEVTLIFSVVLALVFCILFFIHQHYDTSESLATDVVGQFGDFIGGVIGTLLSIVLLYFTFRSQIDESAKNSYIFTKQQFNDIFFHFLSQYNSILNSLSIKTEDDNSLKGKEALHYLYEQMRNDYDAGNINNTHKAAIGLFSNFYSSYIDFAPIYFRTLYRIFDLIEHSGISEQERVRYAKIVRCQLTDTELNIIKYNTDTLMGNNMRKYVIEFNLLKHLMPLNILEYRKWRILFPTDQRGKVNSILYNIRHYIHKLLNGPDNNLAYTSAKARYNVGLSIDAEKKNLKIDFNRRTNIIIPYHDDFTCLDAIPVNEIENLFEKWLLEILFVQNYGGKNKGLKFSRNFQSRNQAEHFTIIAKREGDMVLEI